jgi:hypothetical protein
MNIHTPHPSALDFKRNEVKTLEYLRNWKLVKDFPKLDKMIEFALPNYMNLDKLDRTSFEFQADFPIGIQRHIHQMYVGVRITQNYEEATYFLAIGDKDEPTELIRKFHFDYAHPSNSTDQPVPVFHLQYGGKLSPNMIAVGVKGTKIDSWLSVPRLNFSPVNLAILLDMAFSEFRTEQTEKIVEKSEWRNLIWKNEEFILRKYYKSIADFCTSGSYNSKNLIRDFCYGR